MFSSKKYFCPIVLPIHSEPNVFSSEKLIFVDLFTPLSIEDPISLKLVKCFCCYSASTKTRFGFCSCSELLQLKFRGKKNLAGKCKLLSRQDSYRGD